MPTPDDKGAWGDRLGGADPAAAELVFARYAQRLVRVAEQHLSRKLAGRVDGEDVVQSVFRTFFRRSAAGEFRIDNSGQLWRLLVTITQRKAQTLGAPHHEAGAGFVRGVVDGLSKQSRFEEALKAQDRYAGLIKNPRDADDVVLRIYNAEAKPHEDKQQWAEAAAVFEKGLKRFPTNGGLKQNLEYCRHKAGK
jgi:hypothetical protein